MNKEKMRGNTMTNEEVKEVLELIEEDIDCDGCRYFPDKKHCEEECEDECLYATALKAAIKAVSQKPCEDAVSRTLVLDAVDKWIKCGEWYYSNATDYLFKRMKMLPSVNPTRERGTCLNCAMNHGLMHCEEFNPHDIVCEYWESDGLDKDDYCSQWKKADKGGEDAK